MKTLFFFFVFSFLCFGSELTLDRAVFDGKSVKQLSHRGEGRFESYLTMNLPFAPVKKLFKQLQAIKSEKLKNRGEAHITVVTPIEFFDQLKPLGISMDDIDKIASQLEIQSSSYEVICLGKGSAMVAGEIEQTYFVVVSSNDLLDIRREIQRLVLAKGGDLGKFDPEHYFPHITLGFTKRDLYESDGVLKGVESCESPVLIH